MGSDTEPCPGRHRQTQPSHEATRPGPVGSAPVYPLRKRPDKRHVTMQRFEPTCVFKLFRHRITFSSGTHSALSLTQQRTGHSIVASLARAEQRSCEPRERSSPNTRHCAEITECVPDDLCRTTFTQATLCLGSYLLSGKSWQRSRGCVADGVLGDATARRGILRSGLPEGQDT